FKERGVISYDSRFPNFESIAFLLGDMTDSIAGVISNGVYKMNITNGQITPFLLPPFDSAFIQFNDLGRNGFSNIAVTDDGHYLVATYAYLDSNKFVNSKLGLYDMVENTWKYTNVTLSDNPTWSTSVFHIPVIYDDKIYINVGNSLICHNFGSGKRIWKIDFNADFLFSGYIIEDNQLLANCENDIFYCINPATGAIKWHAEGAGTSSPLRYLNRIVYFSGGSTGRIHAIDTNTGEYVWRLEPDKYDNAEDFKPDIYVAPGQNGEKGKVIICTPTKAYCLPAYR
ncbi:MAG: PQQ-binding-like beta-propeller repeat protein, partial [Saprospiraceae bacterium]